uniref:Putative secreted peptide n=1 Tax=Anopheles braziliensis TaxID=58242 RepID=A0A2M3ZMY7_9DIPT
MLLLLLLVLPPLLWPLLLLALCVLLVDFLDDRRPSSVDDAELLGSSFDERFLPMLERSSEVLKKAGDDRRRDLESFFASRSLDSVRLPLGSSSSRTTSASSSSSSLGMPFTAPFGTRFISPLRTGGTNSSYDRSLAVGMINSSLSSRNGNSSIRFPSSNALLPPPVPFCAAALRS